MRKTHLSRSIALLAASAALAAVRSPHADATMVLTPSDPGEQTKDLGIAPIVTKEMLALKADRKVPSPRPPSAGYQGDLNPVSIAGRNDERMQSFAARV